MNKYLMVLLLLVSFSFSQEDNDTVILRNGDIIKGVIIEDRTDQFIKIKVYGGSTLTFEYSFIYKIERIDSGKEIFEDKKSVDKIYTNKYGVYTNAKNKMEKVYSNKYPSYDTSDSSIKNCYDNGYNSGKKIDVGGTFLGAYGSGLIFGLIGAGISYAVVANSNPSPPSHETYLSDIYCRQQYIDGYKKGALEVKKATNIIGGALGIITTIVIISS